jgi:steroid delta-isomerase-like uncharacterized protein
MEPQLFQSDLSVAGIIDEGAAGLQTPDRAECMASSRAVAQRWYQAFDQHNPALLQAILADEWFDIPAPHGQQPGAGGAIQTLTRLHAAFPDFRIAIRDVLQDGAKVVVRSEISGTHRGSFLGVPPSGRTIRIQAVDIHEVRNGKVTRTWHTEDWMSGLRQIGFFERMATATESR